MTDTRSYLRPDISIDHPRSRSISGSPCAPPTSTARTAWKRSKSSCRPARPAGNNHPRDAGLADAEPRGRFGYYRLLPDAIEAAARFTALAARARATTESPRECR